MLVINTAFKIPTSELQFSFTRSSGPGGQNVNKVNSKAVLRWSVLECRNISEEMRSILLLRLAPRLTRMGEIIVSSDRYRDQIRNREDCLEKLRRCLLTALEKPKQRKKSKASLASRHKLREGKRRQSEKKRQRTLQNRNQEEDYDD